ncbi:MAG: alpha/beta hydrolase [Promethearchaeota archaeon]
MKIFKKFQEQFSIKNVSYSLLALNLLCIAFGIIYLLIPISNIVYDVFGVILLITLFGNLLLIYLNSLKLNRTTKIGNRFNILCYFYLLFIIFAIGWIIWGNLKIVTNYSNEFGDNLKAYAFICFGYFGILTFSLFIAYLDVKYLKNREIWDDSTKGNRIQSKGIIKAKKILRIFIGLICAFIFLIGLYFAALVLFGAELGLSPVLEEVDFNNLPPKLLIRGLNGVIGMFIAQAGLFLGIIFLVFTILFLKVKNKNKSPKSYYTVAIIGIIISGIMIIPLCSTPYYVYSAEKNFAAAFGEDWRDKIPEDINRDYFLKSPFSLPGYFLGIPPKECEVMADEGPYYNNKTEGIKLYFDAYLPKEDKKDLPGENAILIWIHGGGWTMGDKGNYRIQYNKYLAAQGYIVFDLQYGLNDKYDRDGLQGTPDNVKGDFDINDMVRQIGVFIKKLDDKEFQEKYNNPDINSVFISGGSAGGHLTCAVALAIDSGKYEQYFGKNVTIKGLIPYYPGNGLPEALGLSGDNELIHPEELVTKSSPPCLIFHGTNDGLAHPDISKEFRKAYINSGNNKCAILWAPFGGHGCDAYYSGYYSQVFLYYMERFLYLCVNNEI